jgi:xylan 1,4-beta-xylosidase
MKKLLFLVLCIPTLQLVGQVPSYNNPVLPGDFPDPSVIRDSQGYWATATSSEWAPQFPILHSTDLVNWQQVGSIFPDPPTWSTENYWAPELAIDKGRYFVLYTARKRKGPLCVALAMAEKAKGPYRDQGPLVCQNAGSIDGSIIRDENGVLHLIWKEDGNSRNQPTPIWAQPLAEDGSKLVGERRELLRNDPDSWERNLVEGEFILKRNGFFYMFYSGNACCGRECNYALGVARAQHLLGPWEKGPNNPILKGNDVWKCPGHGSIVATPEDRTYLLYHAYHARDFVYAGRQGLLDEITWNAAGWPEINQGHGPSGTLQTQSTPPFPVNDEFDGSLSQGWQWPNGFAPKSAITAGKLELSPAAKAKDVGAVLARSTLSGNYTATTAIDIASIAGASAGIAVYGDPGNAVGLAYNGKLELWQRERGKRRVLATAALQAGTALKQLHLRVTAQNGNELSFAYSPDGETWTEVGSQANAASLPPWDRALRVALTASGPKPVRFDFFRLSGNH